MHSTSNGAGRASRGRTHLPRALVVAGTVALTTSWLSTGFATEGPDSPAPRAEKLFYEALKRMDGGDAAAACPLFEQSYAEEPTMGTRYYLAECYEKTNRALEGYHLFVAVAEEATETNMPGRATQARDRAAALASKLGRLVISTEEAGARLSGLEVRVDNILVPVEQLGQGVMVDPGIHVVDARAPGRKPWKGELNVGPGGVRTLTVTLASVEAPKPTPQQQASPSTMPASAQTSGEEPPFPWSISACFGVAAIGAGVGVYAGVKTLSVHSDYEKAPRAELREKGENYALVSDIGFGVALASAAAGAWLLLAKDEAKETAWNVVPVVTPDVTLVTTMAQF